jgi:NADH:ubiquinone oxidoreductase subunit 4 (subunit M)
MMALFLLSLTGIPPLVGFWGKLAIFGSSLGVAGLRETARPWLVALAVVGVLNSAVAAAYYLRIVGTVFFGTASVTPKLKEKSFGVFLAAVACTVWVVGIGVYPGPWLRWADDAGRQLTRQAVSRSEKPQDKAAVSKYDGAGGEQLDLDRAEHGPSASRREQLHPALGAPVAAGVRARRGAPDRLL